ncbi:hypothetical protein D5F01_LYC04427 [Larimichthys crocea]|uniref:Uncharacterized protein n=1 Tax=Larimichthys crocea TaxID=215358 RepID=A0A6G0J2G6_LARCR|nr:hypothetical protein D5F01_LYC04427 [Larimichthys crocea]
MMSKRKRQQTIDSFFKSKCQEKEWRAVKAQDLNDGARRPRYSPHPERLDPPIVDPQGLPEHPDGGDGAILHLVGQFGRPAALWALSACGQCSSVGWTVTAEPEVSSFIRDIGGLKRWTASSYRSSSTAPPVPLLQYLSSSTAPPVPLLQYRSFSTAPPVPLLQYRSFSTAPPVPLLQYRSFSTAPPVPLLQYRSSSTAPPVPLLQYLSSSTAPPVPLLI